MAEQAKGAGPSRAGGSRADGADEAERGAEPRVTGRDVAKRFVGYYRPFKFLFWFDLVCATVLACIDLAFPQFLNFFTKEFFLQPAGAVLASLGWILALFIALYAVRTACQYFITAWGHVMGARMEADMRRDLFEQYQRLSFGYYDRHNTGVMMSKIVNDLFDISELAHHGPENLFICLLKIIGSFALLFLVNVPLTAIMLAATVLMAVYSAWRNYKKRIIFTENRRKMADINAQLQDSLGGIRVVKSFGNEGVELGKIIFGGPMMGGAAPSADFPVLKQNNGLLLFSKKAAALPEPSACIRCGRCIEACPMGLEPVVIAQDFANKDFAALKARCVDLCVACGSCTYACPAKRPVSQTMGLAKGWYMAELRKGGK